MLIGNSNNTSNKINQTDNQLNINSLYKNLNELRLNNNNKISQPKINQNDYLSSNIQYHNDYNEAQLAINLTNNRKYDEKNPVKINKDIKIDQMTNYQDSSINNKNKMDIFNNQLAEMQKNIMIGNIKQDKMSPGLKIMFENEKLHAQEAIESGIYVIWCSKDKDLNPIECFRLGSNSKCICNHDFMNHDKIITKKKFSSKCQNCKCKGFAYIPLYPEEIGEYWIPNQPKFKYKDYRVKCKCKHAWDVHLAEKFLSCSQCSCSSFFSNFCCVVCDKFWNDHQVIYELEHERYMNKKPIQQDFFPLNECPEIKNLIYKLN